MAEKKSTQEQLDAYFRAAHEQFEAAMNADGDDEMLAHLSSMDESLLPVRNQGRMEALAYLRRMQAARRDALQVADLLGNAVKLLDNRIQEMNK